ncbi:hypothetical protein EJ08DRAFT_664606 [Tothia fuscella]|uniref:Uncharacterized protein n=1 Tax=Tothia fuscella TaxID=1048955 RepID=A0A9P4NIV1_9PEZI|nr:hypothetical protein EJ08DRAFT_664606 [Tothia fuscella]
MALPILDESEFPQLEKKGAPGFNGIRLNNGGPSNTKISIDTPRPIAAAVRPTDPAPAENTSTPRPKANTVQIYIDTGGNKEPLWTDFPLHYLVAASHYVATNIKHLPGVSVLDIPVTRATKCSLIEVLNFIKGCQLRPKEEHYMKIDANQTLDYYLQIYRTLLFLGLKYRFNNQPALKTHIKVKIDKNATITKEQICQIWECCGHQDEGMMDKAVKKMVWQLGIEEDPGSRGNALATPEKTVWDIYMESFYAAKEFNNTYLVDTVNDWYIVAKKAYDAKQLANKIKERKAEKAANAIHRQQKTEADKRKKENMSARGINLVTKEEFDDLPRRAHLSKHSSSSTHLGSSGGFCWALRLNFYDLISRGTDC